MINIIKFAGQPGFKRNNEPVNQTKMSANRQLSQDSFIKTPIRNSKVSFNGNTESQLANYTEELKTSLEQDNAEKAEETAHKVINLMAQNINSINKIKYYQVIAKLTDYYEKQGTPEKSVPVLKKMANALESETKVGFDNELRNQTKFNILNRLESIYIKQANYEELIDNCKDKIITIKNMFGKDHMMMVPVLKLKADTYEKLNKYEDAEKCYIQMIGIAKKKVNKSKTIPELYEMNRTKFLLPLYKDFKEFYSRWDQPEKAAEMQIKITHAQIIKDIDSIENNKPIFERAYKEIERLPEIIRKQNKNSD